ncbi:hypothetical protein VCHENC02_0376B, partial [Vibrio harveyi]
KKKNFNVDFPSSNNSQTSQYVCLIRQ